MIYIFQPINLLFVVVAATLFPGSGGAYRWGTGFFLRIWETGCFCFSRDFMLKRPKYEETSFLWNCFGMFEKSIFIFLNNTFFFLERVDVFVFLFPLYFLRKEIHLFLKVQQFLTSSSVELWVIIVPVQSFPAHLNPPTLAVNFSLPPQNKHLKKDPPPLPENWCFLPTEIQAWLAGKSPFFKGLGFSLWNQQ